MTHSLEAFVLAALAFLRIGIPVAATIGLGLTLRWLDKRWSMHRVDTASAAGMPDAGFASRMADLPKCWEQKGCSEEQYNECPAYKNPNLPCWVARLRVQGRIPRMCASCNQFRSTTAH